MKSLLLASISTPLPLPAQEILWTNFKTSNPAALSSNGGRTVRRTSTLNAWCHASANTYTRSTSGKYYFEILVEDGIGNAGHALGVAPVNTSVTSGNAGTSGRIQYHAGGRTRINGVYSTYGDSYTTGDVIGLGYDFDLRTLRAYKNGVDQGIMYSGGAIPLSAMVPYWSAYYSVCESTFVNNIEFLPPGYSVWN